MPSKARRDFHYIMLQLLRMCFLYVSHLLKILYSGLIGPVIGWHITEPSMHAIMGGRSEAWFHAILGLNRASMHAIMGRLNCQLFILRFNFRKKEGCKMGEWRITILFP